MSVRACPLFSVIIPTHSRQKVLEQTLVLFQGQRLPMGQFQVLVVVNGNERRVFADLVGRFKPIKNIQFLFLKEKNASLARNFGAEKAQGRWLVFTDSDCHPHADWLENVAKVIRKKKGVKVLGGPVLDYVPPGVPLAANTPLAGWEQTYGPRERFLSPREFLLEGNLAIRKDVFALVGGFRADLGPGNRRFGFHEGTELQKRIRQRLPARGAILYSPTIPLRHVIRGGRIHPASRRWRTFLAGYDYAKAFPPGRRSLAGLLIRVLVQAMNYPLTALFRPNSADRVLFRIGELLGQAFQPLGWFPNHVERPGSHGPAKKTDSHRKRSGSWIGPSRKKVRTLRR